MSGVEMSTLIGIGPVTVSNNTISHVVLNSATTTNFYARGVSMLSSATSYTVGGNIISDIQNFSSSSTNQPGGVFVATAATSGTIENNKITGINNRSTGTFGSHGISLSGGNNVTVRNNFVSDVTQNMTGGNAFSGTFGVFGLRVASGTGHKVYHNSINLFGLMAGTASAGNLTAAFGISATGLTGVDVRNNIFANTTTGGSGTSAHVSVFLPSSGTTANMNLTENNNAYYTGTTAGFHGIAHVGTTYTAVPAGPTTFAGLYTAANFNPSVTTPNANLRAYTSTLTAGGLNDNASFASTAAAPFTSPTDLHLNTGLNPTGLESGGSATVGIVVDIDNDTRPGPTGSVNGGATAPDIGADEFDGVPLAANDIAALAFVDPANGGSKPANVAFSPQASFQNTGTAAQTNVPVRYRILDNLSMEVYNQTATIPSLSAGASTTVTFPPATLVSGTYTIKATAENPGDLVPGNDEITGTITVEAALCGNYDVGSGGAFASLTNNGGAFQKLNQLGASCGVTFSIVSDLTGETGANAVQQWVEVGGSGYTLTIKPSGGARAVSGDSSLQTVRGLIKLDGADRVTIDGSTSGGSDLSLTITNNDLSTASGIILVSSGAAGAQNNTIKNVILIGSGNTATFIGIGFGGATIASLGTDNDNNRVEHCDLRKMQFGIATQGASVANKDTGTVITRNIMTATGVNSIGRGAIIASFEDGIQITNNQIDGIVFGGSADALGISLGGLIGWSNATVTGGSEVSNAVVAYNRIGAVQQTNTFSAAGIVVTPATTGTNRIYNNFISGVIANGTLGDFGSGIFIIETGTDSTTQIYNNSISMSGTLTGATQHQFALAVNGGDSTLDIRNNILRNVQTTGTANLSYAIGIASTTFVNLTSDNNDLFTTTGALFAVGRRGSLVPGGAGGADSVTLTNWQTATGKDAASQSVAPNFVSNTDLHLDLAGPGSTIENAGVFLAVVTDDFDSEQRHPTAPDIGADELRCHTGVDVCDDGNACTVDACNPVSGCFATPGNGGAICRPAATGCDVAEVCDGSNAACPADVVAPSTQLCTGFSQGGACDDDAFDHCNGITAACVDVFQPSTVECRGTAGVCDVAESCSGSSGSCPADAFVPSDTLECRPSAGSCDVAESCSGASADCPADGFASVGTSCTGVSNGDVCDGADHCSGVSNTCLDVYLSAATTCRAADGVCDAAETCTGSSGACPADAFAPDTTVCTGVAQGGVCDDDAADHCTGTSNACADAYQGPTFECRASTAMCDPAEFCTGVGSTCPADSVGQSAPVGQTVSVSHNKITNTSTISWTEVIPGPFNVYRGSIRPYQAFAYNETCFAYGVPGSSTQDMRRPSPGTTFFYLISRTQPPCTESNIGQNSAGADRPNPLFCPAPPPDTDGDGFQDNLDNCPTNYNPSQNDIDQDGRGDACDNCPVDQNPDQADADNDNIGDVCDF